MSPLHASAPNSRQHLADNILMLQSPAADILLMLQQLTTYSSCCTAQLQNPGGVDAASPSFDTQCTLLLTSSSPSNPIIMQAARHAVHAVLSWCPCTPCPGRSWRAPAPHTTSHLSPPCTSHITHHTRHLHTHHTSPSSPTHTSHITTHLPPMHTSQQLLASINSTAVQLTSELQPKERRTAQLLRLA
jgi:hypothetical protein